MPSRILAIDVGSSAIRAAILLNGRLTGPIARAAFPTRLEGVRAEVEPADILRALAEALVDVPGAKRADVIALDNMAPSWVALDRRGWALTPIVTHQDRRSIEQARRIEATVGRERHLKLASNRPFPGSISSTTWAWFNDNARGAMKRAGLVGHLSTFLHIHLTGARVTDPSNASFMGVYSTLDLGGWVDELIEAAGGSRALLPEIVECNRIAGTVTAQAARWFGLREGTPVMAGCLDGSAAVFLAGSKRGQLVNVAGSTDVLALCTDRPVPHERLLTRALGAGRWWLSVSTLAAGGSALDWIGRTLFSEMPERAFLRHAAELSRTAAPGGAVPAAFEPFLAGDRMSIEQRWGAFTGLTLSTTRDDMLRAAVEALARASAQRLPLLKSGGTRIRPDVLLTGGVQAGLREVLYRDWKGSWRFHPEKEATLRGLGALRPE